MIPPDFAARCEDKPPHGRAAIYEWAGWEPAVHLGTDGKAIPMWEALFITRIELPEALPYLDGRFVTKVAVHKRAADPARRAFDQIHAAGLWDFLNPYGGGFEFRRVRGQSVLSMHALGLAFDFDPDDNPYKGDPDESRLGSTGEGRAVIRMFEINGWYWGGRFTKHPDAQHFQFATGA
jgi:hypothetical protein